MEPDFKLNDNSCLGLGSREMEERFSLVTEGERERKREKRERGGRERGRGGGGRKREGRWEQR